MTRRSSHRLLPVQTDAAIVPDAIKALDARVVHVELDVKLLLDEVDESKRGERIEDAAGLERRVVAEIVRRLAGQVRDENKLTDRVFHILHDSNSLSVFRLELSSAVVCRIRQRAKAGCDKSGRVQLLAQLPAGAASARTPAASAALTAGAIT